MAKKKVQKMIDTGPRLPDLGEKIKSEEQELEVIFVSQEEAEGIFFAEIHLLNKMIGMRVFLESKLPFNTDD